MPIEQEMQELFKLVGEAFMESSEMPLCARKDPKLAAIWHELQRRKLAAMSESNTTVGEVAQNDDQMKQKNDIIYVGISAIKQIVAVEPSPFIFSSVFGSIDASGLSSSGFVEAPKPMIATNRISTAPAVTVDPNSVLGLIQSCRSTMDGFEPLSMPNNEPTPFGQLASLEPIKPTNGSVVLAHKKRGRPHSSLEVMEPKSIHQPLGLEPIYAHQIQKMQLHNCPVCSFSCRTRFQYNCHLNTHLDRKCRMCDYTCQTKMQMEKHQKNSHTDEERRRVGLEPVSLRSTGPSLLDRMREISENPTDTDILSVAPKKKPEKPLVARFLGDAPKEEPEEPLKNMRVYKCKQCLHTSLSQDDHWNHKRSHIPEGRQLNCILCGFVTELKHHMEIHLNNHINKKPFACSKCSYSCVSKSMLTSHMKCHNNTYPYKCSNCQYETKYQHSFRLHMLRYGHQRMPEHFRIDTSVYTMASKVSTPQMVPVDGSHSNLIQAPTNTVQAHNVDN